jgi:hypothetical protein
VTSARLSASGANVVSQLVESSVPAVAVAITRGLVEELFVHQGQQGPVTVTLERDRDQCFSLRSRTQVQVNTSFSFGSTSL